MNNFLKCYLSNILKAISDTDKVRMNCHREKTIFVFIL